MLLLALSPTLGQNKQKQSSNDQSAQAQVEKLDREGFDAFLKQDASWGEKNEADDYIGIGPDGAVGNKQQEAASMRAGDLKVESATLDESQVRVYGDAAVVIWKMTLKGTYKGQDASGQYRGTNIYAKKGGQWQMVSSQATKIAQ
jgi:ketosteroid isomerase-like protein